MKQASDDFSAKALGEQEVFELQPPVITSGSVDIPRSLLLAVRAAKSHLSLLARDERAGGCPGSPVVTPGWQRPFREMPSAGAALLLFASKSAESGL